MNKTGKKEIVLRVVGVLFAIVALTADSIGLGVVPGFGYKQVALLVLGGVIFYLGIKPCKCQK